MRLHTSQPLAYDKLLYIIIMSRADLEKNLKLGSDLKLDKNFRGLVNIYKSKGITSFDVVQQVKRLTGEKKVGHGGTLDPLAEGVLIMGVGREATKQLRFILEEDKEYIAEIKFGFYSTTDDEEGEKLKVKSRITWPAQKEIEKVLKTFIGDIIQISPAYSAVKIQGERAYKKARQGEIFTRPPRIVTIKEIEILDYSLKFFGEKNEDDGNDKNITSTSQNISWKNKTLNTELKNRFYKNKKKSSIISKIKPDEYFVEKSFQEEIFPVLKIRTVVGSGTYIRSLAREIGERLGTGGYLISLARTKIGNYKKEEAIRI